VRPTIEEQLRGLRAVLEQVVAPEVGAPYPRDLLATVVAALERLEQQWGRELVAMRDESAALDALLADARRAVASVESGLGARLDSAIAAALAQPEPDWLDPSAGRAHYEIRRGLLADVVRELDPASSPPDELRTRIVAHLRAHLAGPL
jgi:hypothetical protein